MTGNIMISGKSPRLARPSLSDRPNPPTSCRAVTFVVTRVYSLLWVVGSSTGAAEIRKIKEEIINFRLFNSQSASRREFLGLSGGEATCMQFT